MTSIEHLRSDDVSVVVDLATGVPTILHWGARVDDGVPFRAVPMPGGVDAVAPVSLVPLHGDGFPGRPGLAGHRRGGRHWSPRFVPVDHERRSDGRGEHLVVRARDPIAELTLTSTFHLTHDGVVTVRVAVRNDGDTPYMLDALSLSLPLPERAIDLTVFGGRWSREFEVHRFAWPYGAWTSENRTGRTSHEHPPYVFASSAGADEWSGEVWGVHLAWSGNHVVYAERLADGRRFVQLGELLHPGEKCVYPGEETSSPEVIAVHSTAGRNAASHGFHREARRRRPSPLTPRRVHLNTWEAVYFDHDERTLRELAEIAATVGIERFVLDDGWFGARRNDRAGLGDWIVSPEVYPNGLAPLVEHVRALGMDFGIWVEPEMANPDSDFVRAHPEWILRTEGYEAVLGRNQLVVDLTDDGAWRAVLGRIDALLTEHDIGYVKWDMNRPLVQASGSDGKSAAGEQTRAVYRMFDELRRRHPRVEFESCSSGGGRIDHEILRRVERVWTSDDNDALERLRIQHGASMVVPPEVLGCHVGPSPAHGSGRRHSMALRGAVALFFHFGVEADLRAMDDRERRDLRRAIDNYVRWRDLVHSGHFVRFDTPPHAIAYGVVSADRSEALVAYFTIDADPSLAAPVLVVPGLRSDATYSVVDVPVVDVPVDRAPLAFPSLTGRDLAAVGLALPRSAPGRAVVTHLSCS